MTEYSIAHAELQVQMQHSLKKLRSQCFASPKFSPRAFTISFAVRVVKSNATPESPQAVTNGAQTALARMVVGGMPLTWVTL